MGPREIEVRDALSSKETKHNYSLVPKETQNWMVDTKIAQKSYNRRFEFYELNKVRMHHYRLLFAHFIKCTKPSLDDWIDGMKRLSFQNNNKWYWLAWNSEIKRTSLYKYYFENDLKETEQIYSIKNFKQIANLYWEMPSIALRRFEILVGRK